MNGRDHEERYALPVYPRRGVTIVRGEGALLWDVQGYFSMTPAGS
jgi:acetylornithine/succinyldiaminopimelate/putrescine aminotransferase